MATTMVRAMAQALAMASTGCAPHSSHPSKGSTTHLEQMPSSALLGMASGSTPARFSGQMVCVVSKQA